MTIKRLAGAMIASCVAFVGSTFSALADGGVYGPSDKAIGMQEPVNELARQLQGFHNDLVMPIITLITIFVFLLLVYIAIRFRKKANPKPAATTHNTFLEVIWTGLPIIILIVISVPSFKLLYFQEDIPETEFAVRAIGNQWNWTFEYPDHDGINFTASMVPEAAYEMVGKNANPEFDAAVKADYESDLKAFLGGNIAERGILNGRLLDTDLRLVLPVDTNIKLYLTASDVIHAWTIPSFGVKMDAVPGRQNESWFRVEKTGTYYGQCSELCGKDHAYMPITVEVVSKEDFAAWVERAKVEFADAGSNKQFAASGAIATGR